MKTNMEKASCDGLFNQFYASPAFESDGFFMFVVNIQQDVFCQSELIGVTNHYVYVLATR